MGFFKEVLEAARAIDRLPKPAPIENIKYHSGIAYDADQNWKDFLKELEKEKAKLGNNIFYHEKGNIIVTTAGLQRGEKFEWIQLIEWLDLNDVRYKVVETRSIPSSWLDNLCLQDPQLAQRAQQAFDSYKGSKLNPHWRYEAPYRIKILSDTDLTMFILRWG